MSLSLTRTGTYLFRIVGDGRLRQEEANSSDDEGQRTCERKHVAGQKTTDTDTHPHMYARAYTHMHARTV